MAELPGAQVGSPIPTVSELLVASGLAESRTVARRIVEDGGAYLNNRRIADPDLVPTASDLHHGRWLVLRRGKRSLAAVEVLT
jgi:tyrosyl-tRNA synthetase